MRSARAAGPAALNVLVLVFCLSLAARAAGASDIPSAATISGAEESALAALAGLGEGDGVILIAPGLQYYAAISRHPRKLSVVHVTPGKEPFEETQFEGWKRAVPVPVDSPALENGAIRGRVGNAELRVVDLARMTAPAKRCMVILDPEFFPLLYENEVRGGLIDLSMKLYRSLSDNGAAGFPLYVVDPLSGPSFPLQWAYAGSLWLDIWRRPAAFRDGLPEKWRLRREAEVMAEFGQFEEAAGLLDTARTHFPKDGSIDFQMARLAFWDRETPVGIRFLNRAFKADPRFLRGFTEFGRYLSSKERVPDAEMVYRAGLRLRADDAALNNILMRLLLERAEASREADPAGARKDLEDAASLRVSEAMKGVAREMLEKMAVPPPK